MSNKGVSPTPWTTAEMKILREVYPTSGLEKCMEMIPRHSATSIRAQASKKRIFLDKAARSLRMRQALAARKTGGGIAYDVPWPGPQAIDGVLTLWARRRERRAA